MNEQTFDAGLFAYLLHAALFLENYSIYDQNAWPQLLHIKIWYTLLQGFYNTESILCNYIVKHILSIAQ